MEDKKALSRRENMELIFQHKMPEYIPHFESDTLRIVDYSIERPIRTTGYDTWGCHWISCPTALGITHPDTNDYKFEEISEWKSKIPVPDLDKVDFSQLKQEVEDFGDRKDHTMLQYTSLNGIFERTHILMGFQNALIACMEDPEEYGLLLKCIADHKIRLFEKIYDFAQPDILVYHDDMATQAAQFLPTDFYVQYIFPQYKRIVSAARQMGYRYIVHHSCGRIEELIPEWLSCGFDGWDSVMPCNDLVAIKRKFSKNLVFLSGLDTQKVLGRTTSTRRDIEEMVVNYLEMLAPDGTGFIFDSMVAYSLNPVNEKICIEFIDKHGKAYINAQKAGMKYIPEFEEL